MIRVQAYIYVNDPSLEVLARFAAPTMQLYQKMPYSKLYNIQQVRWNECLRTVVCNQASTSAIGFPSNKLLSQLIEFTSADDLTHISREKRKISNVLGNVINSSGGLRSSPCPANQLPWRSYHMHSDGSSACILKRSYFPTAAYRETRCCIHREKS